MALEKRKLSLKSTPPQEAKIQHDHRANSSSGFTLSRGLSVDFEAGLRERPKMLWKTASLQAAFDNSAYENNSSESDIDTLHFEIDE